VADALPVIPTFVPFAKKSEFKMVKLLVLLPRNVITTPFVDPAAEIPEIKEENTNDFLFKKKTK
jgi:hypothetical protein